MDNLYHMIDIVSNSKAIHKCNILKCSSSSFGHENLNGQLYNIGEIIWTIWYGSYSNFEKTVSDNSVLETILRRDLDAWRVIFSMDPLIFPRGRSEFLTLEPLHFYCRMCYQNIESANSIFKSFVISSFRVPFHSNFMAHKLWVIRNAPYHMDHMMRTISLYRWPVL